MERMWLLANSTALDIKQNAHENLPRFGPPEGKDLHPACLILYCLYIWSCYNGTQMRSGRGERRWRVLAYARGTYARSDVSLFLAAPPRPYMGARSRDPVQVGYRCMRTLISLGLLGLRVSILFLGRSGYANDEDLRGHFLVNRVDSGPPRRV
jgi:hypothetical protein